MKNKLKQLILDNAPLFWSVKAEDKLNLSEEVVVETILSYGDIEDIKRLFQIIGIHRVAAIFQSQISYPRNNYHPRTKHFFQLYFNRHAS